MPKIIAYVRTDVVGSKYEAEYDIPEDWGDLSTEEKEDYLTELAAEHSMNYGEFGAYVQE
jgi:hypothetical protein